MRQNLTNGHRAAAGLAADLLSEYDKQIRRAAGDPDADAIHDLRVSIRRLKQCLTVFGEHFDRPTTRSIRKQVRSVLDLAGEIRNRDVALELARELSLPLPSSVAAKLEQDRARAQKKLTRKLSQINQNNPTKDWLPRLTEAPDGADDLSLAAEAKEILTSRVSAFFMAGERAARSGSDPAALHQFRLRTKALRYTLELFPGCYGDSFPERMEDLRAVQQLLGAVNDCVASAAIIEDEPGTRKSVAELQRAAESRTAEFRADWRRRFGEQQGTAWLRIDCQQFRERHEFMDVYVLRHGDSEPRGDGVAEADRKLTPKGRRDVKRVMRLARSLDAEALVVFTSPYQRARETAELAAEALAGAPEMKETGALLPERRPEQIWKEIRAHRDAKAVLIVGHEPHLSHLLAFLLGSPALQIDFKKGGLARIQFEALEAQPHGTLKWIMTPGIGKAARGSKSAV